MRALVPIVLIASSACSTATRLPAQRPADFSIDVHTSAGMMPTSSQTRCDATRCTWSGMDSGVAIPEQSRPVTPAQIDSLYAVVRAQRFDRIRLDKHDLLYDAGGTSVAVTAAGQTYSIGNDATESIKESDAPRFQAVVSAVDALVKSLAHSGQDSAGAKR